MNKTAIKNFAVEARVMLINAVTQLAYEFEVTENGTNDPAQESVNGRSLTAAEKNQRSQLIANIRQNGFTQTMEEAAYTWFNRFIALRFMEVNNYLPSHTRIFSDESGNFKPEVLSDAANVEIDGLDKELILELLENQENERLYKYIIITQCNALNKGLPEMFEQIGGWTELLFPRNLLREDSVIAKMITEIPEEDWRDQVQIIGWLYQYYNTEPKDKVFADLKKNIKISAQAIPAATQLFTPDWIVRYMVENSLGRLWAEGHGKPDDADWKYYLDEAEQEDPVKAELEKIRAEYKNIQPENIKIIDPCMGSGHILVYAFDVLIDIYRSCGWGERDAAKSILRNNLYGLDIDRRAYQLAYFAVMMKARQYNRRILNPENQPNLANFADVMGADTDMLSGSIRRFAEQFAFADTYGSLMTVTAPADIDTAFSDFMPTFGLNMRQFDMMMKIYKILSQKYDVVCTNPPYMGGSGMNAKLSDFVKNNFADYKSDLFSAFVIRCTQLCKAEGYLGFLTPYVWMFIQSYEKMRNYIYSTRTIETLIQFEYSAFEEATVPICTFALKNSKVNKKGVYLRLTDFRGGMEVQRQKTLEAIADHKCGYYFETNSTNFSKIPGSPVAYWVSENFVRAFENKRIDSYFLAIVKGIFTGDNKRFLRMWFEIPNTKLSKKWIPYSKGGDFRRWYGNLEYVINWENDALELRNFEGSGLGASKYFKYNTIVWTKLSSYKTGFRKNPKGTYFDDASPALVSQTDDNDYILAFLNSIVCSDILQMLAPTLNYQCGEMKKLPMVINKDKRTKVEEMTRENVVISKQDWDAFETSWDFEGHPLLNGEKTIEKAFEKWSAECEARFQKLKANEEELNRIFIDIYGLQDELTPEVEDKDVTVRKADLQREIKSLISYAVGCLFGRYSLDVKGFAYAGGEWDSTKYKTIIPVKDNVLPICDDDYLPTDLTGLIVDFVAKAYGEDTLDENLKFIADALGGKGTPREVIRSYLLNGFYADHCKIYQKRPIYWLFSSGKKNGFKALVYMHRWERTTVATVRTDYVHELQERYRTQLSLLSEQIDSVAQSDRVKLKKRQEKLTAQLTEINTYEEKVHHLADMMIDIDLDDGVKVNYAKFADILERIK